MTAPSESSKLAELRAKTDRDLAAIIDKALKLGLLLVANEPELDPAGVLHSKASDIYSNAVLLVQAVEDARERRRLEEKLRQLREALDRRVQVVGVSV